MRLFTTITCPNDDAEVIYHIPDEPGSDTTLCGLSDVVYETHDIDDCPITCESCLRVVKWCRNLKLGV